MSFFDDSSLAFLPSGAAGKDGKAYSIKPTDGTGDFTFSRGSNLAATRVGPTGLIEKGRENLLTYSNDFSNAAWTKFGSPTLTSGQSGYDGSSDAWLYESTTASHSMLQFVSGSGVYSFSVYAKAGTADGIRLRFSASIDTNIYVDLTDGSIITDQSGITYNIESVASGWYRISITSNVSSLSNVRLIVVNNAGAETTGTIYIQDAQVEIGLAATDYIESGATTGKAGLLEDEPRFDYSGGATCPSLLLEPSRTNLVDYSEYFGDTSWWFNTSADVELSDNLSPEGVKNAYKVTYGAGGNRLGGANFGLNNTPNTNSIYMRKVSGSGIVDFKTQLGSQNLVTLTESWERYDVTSTLADGTARLYIDLQTLGDVIEVYGAQQEEGSYPTSYIPNHSGGSATMTADVTDRGANLSYTGNYTLFMEFKLTKDAVYLLNSNNSTAYSLFIENDDCYFFFGRTGGDSGFVQFVNKFNWAANLGTNIKMAFYKNGTSSKMFVNGTEYTPSSNTLSTGNEVLDWRYLNYSTTADRQEQVYIKQLLEFEEALSDADCITLTTI